MTTAKRISPLVWTADLRPRISRTITEGGHSLNQIVSIGVLVPENGSPKMLHIAIWPVSFSAVWITRNGK